MPGQPASACSTELPLPTVRPAVALQLLPPVVESSDVSICARAPSGKSAAANNPIAQLPTLRPMPM